MRGTGTVRGPRTCPLYSKKHETDTRCCVFPRYTVTKKAFSQELPSVKIKDAIHSHVSKGLTTYSLPKRWWSIFYTTRGDEHNQDEQVLL